MSGPIRTIVAGISQPVENDPTLLAAAALARRTGARLHLVMAFTPPPVFSPPQLAYTYTDWLLLHTENLQTRLEAAARRLPGGESATGHAVAGAPAPAILDTAERVHADMVVVGAARPGRLGGSFLGTTAQRVLRGADVPVLVVRRPLRTSLRRVLLTTDLSEQSAAVHEQGLDTVAALFGEPLAARSLLVVSCLILPSPLSRGALDAAARAEAEGFLRTRRPRSPAVEPVIRSGAPGEEIPAEAAAWDADLLVVGTHARGWGERLLLGSVAEASLRDAPCNVLAIPPRALALEQPSSKAAPAEEPAGVMKDVHEDAGEPVGA